MANFLKVSQIAFALTLVSICAVAQKEIYDDHVGQVSTIATFQNNPKFLPGRMVTDTEGNIYITGEVSSVNAGDPEYWRPVIYKITPNNEKIFLAGSEIRQKDGFGKEASFSRLNGIAIDKNKNLYVTDVLAIRRVSPNGEVSTIVNFAVEGKNKESLLYGVKSLGELLIDISGDFILVVNGQLVKVGKSGTLTVIAGDVYDKKRKEGDQLVFGGYMTQDESGSIITSSSKGLVKVTADGTITSISNISVLNYKKGHLDGPADKARLEIGSNFVIDKVGNIFLAEYYNQRIRKIKPDGSVTTAAGSGPMNGYLSAGLGQPVPGGFRDGAPDQAVFNCPGFLAFDRDGNLLIADTVNYSIRRLILK